MKLMSLNNFPVNRSDFRLIRGVQNEILFFVRDLDRNPASTSSFQQVTINIVDPKSSTLLMSRNLSVVTAPSALYMLTILAAETANWEVGSLQWSISVTRSDGSTVMLWTDMNYGPYSMLEMTHGPTPGPTVASILNPSTFTLVNMVPISGQLPGAAQLGYQNGMQTFAVYPVAFTGSIEIDGTLASQPGSGDWFAVSTTNFVLASSLSTINVTGNYLWLRVQLPIVTSGSINQILYKY
jgi:hypothetical protein